MQSLATLFGLVLAVSVSASIGYSIGVEQGIEIGQDIENGRRPFVWVEGKPTIAGGERRQPAE